MLKLIISSDYYGQRLDKTLALLFPDYSRAQLVAWLKSGRITVDPPFNKLSDKVHGNETITYLPLDEVSSQQAAAATAEAIPLDIMFEDEHCLVINKPAGLIAHPGAGNPQHTLVNALLHHDARLHALPRAGLIHRLDKDTTGLLLIAKTEAAYTALVRQMQARAIEREYLALVHGTVISGGRIETGYGRSPQNRLKMAVLPQGRTAITLFSVHSHYPGCTLLNVKLMTGRTHQIRVHMAHIKHPILGDPLYTGRTRIPGGLTPQLRELFAAFKRQALHAQCLSFIHPETQERLTLNAPMPEDFQQLLHALAEVN
jgi:23S rRNA pseudouridine1911/1915/1917 synthase